MPPSATDTWSITARAAAARAEALASTASVIEAGIMAGAGAGQFPGVERVTFGGGDHRRHGVRAGIGRHEIRDYLADLGRGEWGQSQPGYLAGGAPVPPAIAGRRR